MTGRGGASRPLRSRMGFWPGRPETVRLKLASLSISLPRMAERYMSARNCLRSQSRSMSASLKTQAGRPSFRSDVTLKW